MEKEKIFMGLDLGTHSCGWAVTDENYNIIKKSGKHLHGVRKFDEAKVAAERRVNRSSRRRLDRRKFRLEILQDFFKNEINKVDPLFFIRLNNSFYNKDDKDQRLGKYSLFNDQLFSDKEYYQKFKTIFHLRHHLMTTKEKQDVRLVYLACHNILKYRGNFLMEKLTFSAEHVDYSQISNLFFDMIETLNTFLDEEVYSLDVTGDNIKSILNIFNRYSSKNDQAIYINKIINQSNLEHNKKLVDLIVGKTVQFKDLLLDDKYKSLDHPKVSFTDSKYETEIEPALFDMLGDVADAILKAKAIYNWFIVKKYLGDDDSISQAKVQEYQTHHNDLIKFKTFIRKFYDKSAYDEMFRLSNDKINNYASFVKTNLINNEKQYVKGCSYQDFLKYVKKVLKQFEEKYAIKNIDLENHETLKLDELSLYKEIKNKVDNETFLPKQRVISNSVLPYQLHMAELMLILNNAKIHYAFLNESDTSGLTVINKIEKLMSFRIPYYIGPLNNHHNVDNEKGFSWVVRKESGQVLPWNFEEKVDVFESAQKFIRNMTKKCTYLNGKDVLPKNSLLYSEFSVLNELNNLQVNGEKLSPELKTDLVNCVFKRYKKVTIKRVKQFLLSEGIYRQEDKMQFAGIDGEFKNSLSSWITFSKIFGQEYVKNHYEMIERIIFLLTIFEDNTMALKMIEKKYSILNEEDLKAIKRLTFSGWGRLSKEFLDGELYGVSDLGEKVSIIDLMRRKNLNLQSVLYDPKYNFLDRIKEINNQIESTDNLSYDELMKEVYVSPGIKRSIRQALKIIDESKKILGKPIDTFFVEVARGGGIKGKRTDSRRKQIEALYKKAKVDKKIIDKMLNELNKVENNHLRADKLFLYFMQLGKCMYSKEKIDIERLNTSAYDIDHIIPRASLKDDSLTNRVLVLREKNEEKGDIYPVSQSIRDKMTPYWNMLRSINLINGEKYKRLTRSDELSYIEKGEFINRQLVFTSQSVKALNEILIKLNPNAKVVYSKAGNVSEFRHQFDLVKSRSVNDFHHAHDAYLNIVVGNTYHKKFGWNAIDYFKNKRNFNTFTNTKKMFDKDIKGAWVSDGSSLRIVKKMLKLKDVLVTKMVFRKKGEFYDQMVQPASNNKYLYPLKNNSKIRLETKKYGGYIKGSIAYFSLIKHWIKGEERVSLIGIPVLYSYKINQNQITYKRVLEEELGYVNPKVVIKCIRKGTLMKIDKTFVNLAGVSNDRIALHNANQLYLKAKSVKYIKLIEKHITSLMNKFGKINCIQNEDVIGYQLDHIDVIVSSKKNKENFTITKKDNLDLYDELVLKFKNGLYQGISMDSYYPQLLESRNKYMNLNPHQQSYIIYNMIMMMKCNAETGNLNLLMNRSQKKGKLIYTSDITDKKIVIYDESITGFYRSVRWMNK